MKKYEQEPGFETRIANTILGSLWGLITMPFRKKASPIDRSRVQAAWQEVERLADGSYQEVKLAVVKADSVVDGVLKLKVIGETTGERLKNAESRFSRQTHNNLWEAHKLRNSIAHEAHFEPDLEDLRVGVARFRRALQEIGIL
ncbi:MAG: hypothetical protein WAP74_02055 [Patescibacteria group bacterium]